MWKFALAMAVGCTLAAPAAAQDYPTKPVRVIVPYNAGGAVDYLGRVVAQELSERLGQQFVVENRAGASGNIGAQAVVSSQPDGYTLLMTSVTSNALTTGLNPEDAGFDLKEDLVAAGMVGLVPFVFVVNADVPVTNVDEFVAYAKEQTEPLAYASSGVGSAEHLGTELLAGITGIEMLHIPYTGAAPAITDVVAGRIPVMLATVPTALPHIDAGNVTPLVVAVDERVDNLPDVPTSTEVGLDDFKVMSLYGLLAPADVDPAILEVLNTTIAEIAGDPEFATKLSERGILPIPESAGSAQEMFVADVDKWRKLIAETDLSGE